MTQESIVKVFTAFEDAIVCMKTGSPLNIVFEKNMDTMTDEELDYFSDICLLLPVKYYKLLSVRNKKLGQLKPYQLSTGVYHACLHELKLVVSTTADTREFVDYILGTNNENKEAAVKVSMAWVIDWLGYIIAHPDYTKLNFEYTKYYAVNNKMLVREHYVEFPSMR